MIGLFWILEPGRGEKRRKFSDQFVFVEGEKPVCVPVSASRGGGGAVKDQKEGRPTLRYRREFLRWPVRQRLGILFIIHDE